MAPIRPAIPPPVTISRVTMRGHVDTGVLGEPAVVPGQPDLVAEGRPRVHLHDQRDDDHEDQALTARRRRTPASGRPRRRPGSAAGRCPGRAAGTARGRRRTRPPGRRCSRELTSSGTPSRFSRTAGIMPEQAAGECPGGQRDDQREGHRQVDVRGDDGGGDPAQHDLTLTAEVDHPGPQRDGDGQRHAHHGDGDDQGVAPLGGSERALDHRGVGLDRVAAGPEQHHRADQQGAGHREQDRRAQHPRTRDPGVVPGGAVGVVVMAVPPGRRRSRGCRPSPVPRSPPSRPHGRGRRRPAPRT